MSLSLIPRESFFAANSSSGSRRLSRKLRFLVLLPLSRMRSSGRELSERGAKETGRRSEGVNLKGNTLLPPCWYVIYPTLAIRRRFVLFTITNAQQDLYRLLEFLTRALTFSFSSSSLAFPRLSSSCLLQHPSANNWLRSGCQVAKNSV